MHVKAIFDWPKFASWYLLPTLVVGGGKGGWCYLLWLHGRIGLMWYRA